MFGNIKNAVKYHSPDIGNPAPYAVGKALAYLFMACMLLAPLPSTAQDAGMPDAPPNVLSNQKLLEALRGGGYVIYFRHSITDLSTTDTDRDHLENCAAQRKLSGEGRRLMRNIGAAAKRLGIHVSKVLSSPYCRSIETAKLAFGRAEVTDDLVNTVTADEETVARKAQALKKLLSTPPAAGTNTVLSSHSGNLQEATGIWPKPEGVAIVFKPEGGGQFSYVARIEPAQWGRWAHQKSPSP